MTAGAGAGAAGAIVTRSDGHVAARTNSSRAVDAYVAQAAQEAKARITSLVMTEGVRRDADCVNEAPRKER